MEAPVQMTSEPLSKERHMEAKEYLAYIVNEIHTTMLMHPGVIDRVIFNVFKDEDREYYEQEL